MIAMIGRLIETGHAYAAEGHVLFHVPSMPSYGALSRRNLDELSLAHASKLPPISAIRAIRAMETLHRRRSRMGQPLGTRPAGLAY